MWQLGIQTIVLMKLQGTFIIEVDYGRYETATHLILQVAKKIKVTIVGVKL